MLKRLRWKFTLLLLLVLSGVLAAVLAVQTVSAVRQYRAGTDQVLHNVLLRSQAALEPWSTPPQGGFDRDEGLYTAIPAFCAVVDRTSGQVLLALSYNAAVDEDGVTRAVEAALAAGEQAGQLPALDLRYQLQGTGRYLRIAFADLTWERTGVRQQVLTAVLLFAAASAGFFAVSWVLTGRLVRPVEEGWKRQQQFVADASHELKTPLTVMLADADILLAHPDDTVGQQRKWVECIRDEGLRMKGLVQDLLYLARGDAGQRSAARETVSLSDLWENCVLGFEPVAFEAGLTLQSQLAPDVCAAGDREELRRLAAILLDNACKYCEPGGTVTVTLTGGERAVLTVHNTGEPIPADVQPHLFERFYRADAARSRETGGYGLGLSIAAAIVKEHRGKITLHSAPGEGTAFTVTLPSGQTQAREKNC